MKNKWMLALPALAVLMAVALCVPAFGWGKAVEEWSVAKRVTATQLLEVTGVAGNTPAMAVSGVAAFTPATQTSVSSGGTIAWANTVQPITAAGAVTTSTSTAITAGSFNGQLLILLNAGGYAITVKNNAKTVLGGDVVLDSGDGMVLVWMSDAVAWVRIATADNS